MAAMIEMHPTLSLEGIYNTLKNFQMPGVGIPGFLRRSIEIARAGVYNLRVHHDNVLMPVIRQWGIPELKGLDVKAAELQEKILALPAEVIRKAERFEARFGMA